MMLPDLIVVAEAPGAWPNGSRVVKAAYEPGDRHRVGALATVIGSVGPFLGLYGYFVEWDDDPFRATFVRSDRLRLLEMPDPEWS